MGVGASPSHHVAVQCLGILSVRMVDAAGRVVCGVCPTWSWPDEWRHVVHTPGVVPTGAGGRNVTFR